VRECYLRRLESGLARERMRLLPGVVETLEALRAPRADRLAHRQLEGGARVKLARFDQSLLSDRRFRRGRSGPPDLPPRPRARAALYYGESFRPEETLIVGDSPLDVQCARAHGAGARRRHRPHAGRGAGAPPAPIG
jgi:phosphoglycolate phosphatase-like HAD superfamily hydrolase